MLHTTQNTKNREASQKTQTADNAIGNAGVGYIVIPPSMTPDEYIEDCYRTNTVTIWGGRGYGFFSGIHVAEQVMQDIQFPQDPETNNRGSAVVWIKDESSQLPVIVSTLRQQEDFFNLEPNQYRLKRCIDDKRAIEVFIDAKTSSMIVNLTGDNEESADLNIKVTSENKDSVINVYSDGEVNVSANEVTIQGAEHISSSIRKDGITQTRVVCEVDEGMSSTVLKKVTMEVTDEDGEPQMQASYEVENGFTYEDEFKNKVICADGEVSVSVDDGKADIKYKSGDGFSYKDEFNNEIVCKNGEVDIKSQTIKETGNVQHNNGSEPMVKGQTLMNILNELIGACMAITVTTPVGPSTVPVNAAQFVSIQSKLQTMLSQKSKLD